MKWFTAAIFAAALIGGCDPAENSTPPGEENSTLSTDGTDGTTGKADGTDGTAATDGTDGTDGMDATDGTDGTTTVYGTMDECKVVEGKIWYCPETIGDDAMELPNLSRNGQCYTEITGWETPFRVVSTEEIEAEFGSLGYYPCYTID